MNMDTSLAAMSAVQATLVHDSSEPSESQATLTIAIPTYRRPGLLLKAIESVLQQTDLNQVELLVVDNDADSDSKAVVERLRQISVLPVRYLRNHANVGMFGNWNRCVVLCRTEWLTILNDDDLLLPEYVREMRAGSERSRSAAYACRCLVQDDRPVERQGNRRLNLINRLLALRSQPAEHRLGAIHYFLQNRHYGSLGLMFRRRAAEDVQGFDASYYPSSDFHFFSSLAVRGGVTLLQKPLAVYRISVNESLKLETINRWREIDADIRRALGTRVLAPAWLKERYIRLAAIHEYLGRTRESQIVTISAARPVHWLRRHGTLLALLGTGLALQAWHAVAARAAETKTSA